MLNIKACLAFVISITLSSTVPVCAGEDNVTKNGAEIKGLQQRIDFGNAYILGQSIKSGAVYLLHRKQSELKGMLEVRRDYREEIMEDYNLEKTAIVTDKNERR